VPGLASKANSTHTHAAADVTSGTFTSALVPAATSAAKGGVIVPAADCNAATTAKVLYTAGTNTFSCGTDQSGGSIPAATTSTLGGVTVPPSGGLLYGNASGAMAATAAGVTGSLLTLQSGPLLAWVNGPSTSGFGTVPYSSGPGGSIQWWSAPRIQVASADVTNATTTMSNIFSWNPPSSAVSRSMFECDLAVKSSATTLGTQFDVSSTVAPTAIEYKLTWVSAAGTAPSTAGTTAFVQTVVNATALGPTTGLTTITHWKLEGSVVNTAAANTINIRFKASGTGTVTVQQGSSCIYFLP